jgi:hypothetical protein
MNKVQEHKDYISKIAYFTLGEQVVSMPYLNCGRIDEKFSCLDYYKIRNFNDLLKNNEELARIIMANLFKYGQKKVRIKVIFDENNKKKCINLPQFFNNLNCGFYILYNKTREPYYQKKDVIKIPILIRYKDKNDKENAFKYKVGLLIIESYY